MVVVIIWSLESVLENCCQAQSLTTGSSLIGMVLVTQCSWLNICSVIQILCIVKCFI